MLRHGRAPFPRSRCSSIRGTERAPPDPSCGPPRPARDAAPRVRSRALPGRGRPARDRRTRPGIRRSARGPHHQTTVAPIAPSDRPSGPWIDVRAAAGADLDGDTQVRPGVTGSTARSQGTRLDGPDGMLGQDRRRWRGGPTPSDTGWGLAPSACPAPGCGRQCVPAGVVEAGSAAAPTTGRRADGRSGRRRPRRTPARGPGGLRARARVPRLRPDRLAPLGPAALALAVRGAVPVRALARPRHRPHAFFVPLLSWSGIVGPLPWLALAGWEALHLALLGGATALVSGLRWWPVWAAALWVADEGAARALRPRRLPWGRLGFQPDRGPLLCWPPTAGSRWSPSRSPSPARC